jgi:hypothetical protein
MILPSVARYTWRMIRKAVFALIALSLVACGTSGAAGDVSSAARNVETYLLARVSSDTDQMITLSCAAWEPTARIEATSFKSLKARLEGVACTATANGNSAATVSCSGKILTTYNGEDRALDLSSKPFSSVLEGGEWRMCGYK